MFRLLTLSFCALLAACSSSGPDSSGPSPQDGTFTHSVVTEQSNGTIVLSPRTATAAVGYGVFDPSRPVPRLVAPCDSAGEACCEADGDVPTPHCLGGVVGCNVVTGTCEPCGGANQVCCDGPRTAFNGRNLSYEPDPLGDPAASPEMCAQPASCDAQLVDGRWEGSRTCRACGTTEGAACCAKDARYGVGRCGGTDPASGARLKCADPFAADASTCIECGRWSGQPACDDPRPCDDGMNDQNGTCVLCGVDVGMQICDTGEECRSVNLVPDPLHVTCVQAGGLNQPCEKDGACGYSGLSCQGGVCHKYCGVVGLACCGADVGS